MQQSSESRPMGAAPESRRVDALVASGLLDSPAERRFDRLTKLLSVALKVPVATISLVDTDRQFFKSAVGLAEPVRERRETPLSHSFCRHVVEAEAPLVVHDARNTPLVAGNPAIDELGVEAYLGVPIADRQGVVIGSLCAIDHTPRHWSEADLDVLVDVATMVQREIADQKATEALSDADQSWRMMMNAMPQMVWVIDPDGQDAGYNRSWLDFTGMPKSAPATTKWWDYCHPDDRAQAESVWHRAHVAEQSFDVELRFRHHTGDHHAMLVRGVPLRGADGSLERWVCSGTDIQTLKDAQAAREQSRHEVIETVAARLADAATYVPEAEFQAIRGVIATLRDLDTKRGEIASA